MLESNNQARDFPQFLGKFKYEIIVAMPHLLRLERAIEEYEAESSALGAGARLKQVKEFNTPQMLDVDNKLYLVAGESQIFLLGDDSGDDWARKLTLDEIEALPVGIQWDGPEVHFETDKRKVTELGM